MGEFLFVLRRIFVKLERSERKFQFLFFEQKNKIKNTMKKGPLNPNNYKECSVRYGLRFRESLEQLAARRALHSFLISLYIYISNNALFYFVMF